MAARKFRLRNNAIVKECSREDTCFSSDGYIDDYKIIEYGDIDASVVEIIKKDKDYLCLRFAGTGNGFPIGGAHGRNFDIVEEIAL